MSKTTYKCTICKLAKPRNKFEALGQKEKSSGRTKYIRRGVCRQCNFEKKTFTGNLTKVKSNRSKNLK